MLKAMKMNDLGGGKAYTSLPEDMRPQGTEMCCPRQGHHRLAILQQTYRLRIDTWNEPNSRSTQLSPGSRTIQSTHRLLRKNK